MTKRELLEALEEYPMDSRIVIEVHDTVLHEDLYYFNVEEWEINRGYPDLPQWELRLCPEQNNIES